jgi:ribonuclease HII
MTRSSDPARSPSDGLGPSDRLWPGQAQSKPIPTGLICGVDEAGRGPLAGPVVAAAVILDPTRPIEGLKDSKVLSSRQRDRLAGLIREHALGWSVASASVEEIDQLNILQATLLAMRRAVLALPLSPQRALVDGHRAPVLPCEVQTLVRGDALEACISAASILAKTDRDAQMLGLHEAHPLYGFHVHKGYPTRDHLEALRRHGPSPVHRRSFAPVRACLQPS